MIAPPPELIARLAACLRGDAVVFTEWSSADVLAAAASQGVTPLLADRLIASGGDSGELRAALQRERTLGSALELLRGRELQRVLSALGAEGISPVLVKGSALAWTLYADPALRSRFDSDLFIRRQDREAIAGVMAALGYSRPAQVTGDLVMHQVDYVRKDPAGIWHVLDFHWKLSNRQAVADVLAFDEVSAAAEPIAGSLGLARCASRVHALVIACVHRVAHHSADERLIWLYDIHLLAASLSAAQVEAFVALSKGRSVTLICADGLLAARRAFQTTLPAGLLERLTPTGRPAAEEPSAVLLSPEPTLARELLSDLKAIRWPERVRLLREHAFPPAHYMSAAYMVSNRAWLPALYTHRLVRGAWRLLRGAAR